MKKFLLLSILAFLHCSDPYIRYDKNKPAENGNIKEKSRLLLYTYIINQSTVYPVKSPEGSLSEYRCSAEDKAVYLDGLKSLMKKSTNFQIKDGTVLQNSKTASSLKMTEEENLLNISGNPLVKESKHRDVFSAILSETDTDQVLLAKIHYNLSHKEISQYVMEFKLHATLTVLMYDRNGRLIFSSEKTAERQTNYADDKFSVGGVFVDALNLLFNNKTEIPIHKSCRPVLQENLNELWNSTLSDLKKKYPSI